MNRNEDSYSRLEIDSILKLQDAGVSDAQICSQHNISRSTLAGWQSRFKAGGGKFTGPQQAKSGNSNKLLSRKPSSST